MRMQFVLGGVATALLMSASAAWAQGASGGIKGGVNSSTLAGPSETGTTTSRRTGLTAGAFVAVRLAPLIAFQPEVMYSQEGATARMTAGTVTIEGRAKLDYIRVPLLLRLGRAGKSGPYVVIGPALGKLVNAKLEITGQPTEDVKDVTRTSDVSVVAGVGVNASHVLVEGRYTGGLQDISRTSSTSTTKNRSFSVLVGVHF